MYVWLYEQQLLFYVGFMLKSINIYIVCVWIMDSVAFKHHVIRNP